MIEPFAGSATPVGPRHGDVVEQRHQFLGVRRLPWCEPDDQRPAATFTEQMQFGGQSSP
jgi:hypothetical protein